MRNSLVAVGLAALALVAGGVAALEMSGLMRNEGARPERAIAVEPEREAYARGETVAFALRNVGRLALEGTPDVRFLDADGNVVGALMTAQVIQPLEPGQALQLAWETGSGDGGEDALPAGVYTIEVRFAGLEAQASVTLA